MDVGYKETYVSTADGAVMAWGDNAYGQVMDGHLLDPTPEYRKTPPPLMDTLSPHLASDTRLTPLPPPERHAQLGDGTKTASCDAVFSGGFEVCGVRQRTYPPPIRCLCLAC